MSTHDTDTPFDPPALAAVADRRRSVMVGADSRARMARAEAFARERIAAGERIYGWTTGFGPLAGHTVEPEADDALQYKLLAHLATGVAPPFTRRQARAILAARLGTLCLGGSAVRPAVAQMLADCLNVDLVPVVPQQGTVGASGDLTPLAHIALVLHGEGTAWLDGRKRPAADALEAAGLAPLALAGRTGLALVNGTDAMTGVAALNGVDTLRATEIATLHAVLYVRALGGTTAAFDPGLGAVRPHPGQRRAHRDLAALAAAVPPWRSAPSTRNGARVREDASLQDAYTLRCAPQILGAVHDALAYHDSLVTTELASVTDNPVFRPETDDVLHGGNFQGQHVAFASDTLATGIIKLAELAERRVARLTDAALNQGLPPFLTGGRVGLDSGLMGAQVTATALLAEMRTRALPAGVQSMPTNANNQDIVSLGTIAARKAAALLDDLFALLAIEALALAQAADHLVGDERPASEDPGAAWVALVRQTSPHLTADRPLYEDIGDLASMLRDQATTIPWVEAS
jgi:tyrosine ammonia-lyase